MKKNQTVINLCKKAERTGEAVTHKKGEEVYHLICKGRDVKLYHYKTQILHYNRDYGIQSVAGGWSVSDRDAINNVLDFFGSDARVRLVITDYHPLNVYAQRKSVGHIEIA